MTESAFARSFTAAGLAIVTRVVKVVAFAESAVDAMLCVGAREAMVLAIIALNTPGAYRAVVVLAALTLQGLGGLAGNRGMMKWKGIGLNQLTKDTRTSSVKTRPKKQFPSSRTHKCAALWA